MGTPFGFHFSFATCLTTSCPLGLKGELVTSTISFITLFFVFCPKESAQTDTIAETSQLVPCTLGTILLIMPLQAVSINETRGWVENPGAFMSGTLYYLFKKVISDLLLL